MKSLLTADDVLSDIEFELVQGTISRDELGQSIQAVRQYQNKIRSEVLESARQTGYGREMIGRLFQINDMLITLLQEVSTALQSLRLDLRKVARKSQVASPAATTASVPVTEPVIEPGSDAPAAVDVRELDWPEEDFHWQSSTEVESAMRSEALQIGLETRSIGMPVVGGLITRVRVALHSLVLFYVDRLAKKQLMVNQTYGDWILRLVHKHQHQQEQIELLSARVASLEARLFEADGTLPPAATS